MELTNDTELNDALIEYEARSFNFKAKQMRVNQLLGLKKKRKKGYSKGTYNDACTLFE